MIPRTKEINIKRRTVYVYLFLHCAAAGKRYLHKSYERSRGSVSEYGKVIKQNEKKKNDFARLRVIYEHVRFMKRSSRSSETSDVVWIKKYRYVLYYINLLYDIVLCR